MGAGKMQGVIHFIHLQSIHVHFVHVIPFIVIPFIVISFIWKIRLFHSYLISFTVITNNNNYFRFYKANGLKCFVLIASKRHIFSFLYENKDALLDLWSDMNLSDKISQYPIVLNETCWLDDIMDIFPNNEILISH